MATRPRELTTFFIDFAQRILKKKNRCCFWSEASVVIEPTAMGSKLTKKIEIVPEAKPFTAISAFVELVWTAGDILRAFRLASDVDRAIKWQTSSLRIGMKTKRQ